MDVKQFHSALDSMRFGFKVAKVNAFDSSVNDLINALKIDDYKLILSRVDANDIQLINELETSGFLLKDVQLTYKYELTKTCTPPINEEITIREAHSSDKERLYQISINSFVDYGHYSADKKLNSLQCREIHGDWIVRSFDKDVADNIIVAEINGEIAGFLSFKIYENQYRYAAGGLGAVAPEFRNKDVFRAINLAGFNWAIERDCQWVEHNVLVTNPPVMRSLIKLGFKPSNSSITFHKWL